MSVFYRVDAADERLDPLAAALAAHRQVEAAFVKPAAEPPVFLQHMLTPIQHEALAVTPDFTVRQLYLGPGPAGVEAHWAWKFAGGSGLGVRIVDVEGEWRFSHEDLLQNQGVVVGGTPPDDLGWRNHGTAVMGEFSGDRNSLGITGICPDANVRAISIFGGAGSAAAIHGAANLLDAGDIILVELHQPGPRYNFADRDDQLGSIPVEWRPDTFASIQYATGRGIIVIEAGGNGAEDLDAAIYDSPADGFPAAWTNPFRRTNDSDAILVGAGALPPGTHGRSYGPDRSRLGFSTTPQASTYRAGVAKLRPAVTATFREVAARTSGTRTPLAAHRVHRRLSSVCWRNPRGIACGEQAPVIPGKRASVAPYNPLPSTGCAWPPDEAAHRAPTQSA